MQAWPATSDFQPDGTADRPAVRVAVAFSRGIRALRHIEQFLGVQELVAPRAWSTADAGQSVVVVWGRKQNADRAQAFAARHGLPVWYLEDGFIRSCAANPHGRLGYSLLVDPVGVYYDSGSPSYLENTLNLPAADFARLATADALAEALWCRTQIIEQEVTKYNYCRPARLPAEFTAAGQALVLVVDQTQDDASVRCGGMPAERFPQMLQAAIDENPGARVVLRTHPDVIAGRRAGYLDALARHHGIPVIAEADNPLGWLKHAERVYVATSQLGYEALLCGCKVVTFGQPFYAGWGLTDDRSPLPRRIRQRTLDELFLVCHMLLPRYRHPVTGASWTLRECLEHVCLQKREFARNAWHFHAVAITPWKRRYVRQFLRSPEGSVQFLRSRSLSAPVGRQPARSGGAPAAGRSDLPGERSVWLTWGFRDQSLYAALPPAAGDRPATEPAVVGASAGPSGASTGGGSPLIDRHWPTVRLEDGFLRSRGLGSDFVAPGSLVADSRGLYFDPARPSDLEYLLNTADCSPDELQRAHRLRAAIVSAGLSKYNLQGSGQPFWKAADTRCALVIGQVDDDQSVRRGSPEVRSNRELLAAVRQARPHSLVVYRPHPDVVSGNRRGEIDDVLAAGLADAVDTDSPIVACIDACDELHTMTSLTGFEALLRGCRVVTYGLPFYAGWGLTEDRLSLSRRVRVRTLDELVYLTLIVYARYVDIDSGEFISPEDRVAALQRQLRRTDQTRRRSTAMSAPFDKLSNIVKGLRYAP